MMGKGADNALVFDHANRMEGIPWTHDLNSSIRFSYCCLSSYSFRCIFLVLWSFRNENVFFTFN